VALGQRAQDSAGLDQLRRCFNFLSCTSSAITNVRCQQQVPGIHAIMLQSRQSHDLLVSEGPDAYPQRLPMESGTGRGGYDVFVQWRGVRRHACARVKTSPFVRRVERVTDWLQSRFVVEVVDASVFYFFAHFGVLGLYVCLASHF
jgi:hypothetical protein